MTMTLIRLTEKVMYKKWWIWKWIFQCSYCWNEKEILNSNIKSVHSCWCVTKELFYKSRMEKSETQKTVIDMWDYIEFSLTNWWFCKIDKSDYDIVKWSSWYKSIRWYVETRKNTKLIKIHRLLTNDIDEKLIDHINRDKLDNRKSNLRLATHKQNIHNSRQKSGKYKWVYTNKKWKYVARCRNIWIWVFDIENDAAIAYNKVAIKEFWEFAFLNTI